MIRLKAPDGHASVGFGGSEYDVRDGIVDVPEEAAVPLRAHGYAVPDAAEPARPPARRR